MVEVHIVIPTFAGKILLGHDLDIVPYSQKTGTRDSHRPWEIIEFRLEKCVQVDVMEWFVLEPFLSLHQSLDGFGYGSLRHPETKTIDNDEIIMEK